MAKLKCGMYSFVINYEEYSKVSRFEYYTYSLRISMWEKPLFSDAVASKHLSSGGAFLFTSDDEDRLLEAFKALVDESTPLDDEIVFYSEIDGQQEVCIRLYKKKHPRSGNWITYHITFELSFDSFLNPPCPDDGDIHLVSQTDDVDDILRFISELEDERTLLLGATAVQE